MKKVRILSLLLSLIMSAVFCATLHATGPCKVKTVKSITYKEVDGKVLKLNLFLPVKEGAELKGFPLLINVTGGCWISGNPGNGSYWTKWKMVEKGYAVADVAHRSLNSGYSFPTQMEDIRAAIRFLRARSSEYGYDPQRFACMGMSSSGFMSCIAGISDKHKIFDVGENLDQSSQVQCVVDFCGPADILSMIERQGGHLPWCLAVAIGAKYPPDTPPEERKKINYADQVKNLREAAVRYSPITYVDKDFAPTIVLHGCRDTVVPPSQACLFHESLKRAGVVSELYLFNEGKHSPATYGPNELLRQPILEFVEKILGKP